MSLTTENFAQRLAELREELIEQGRRSRALVDLAFDSFLMRDADKARAAIALDDEVDRIDVEIERQAVDVLTEVARGTVALPPEPLWSLLTLVKINNDFERMADAGVTVAERALSLSGSPTVFPPTTRVMTNSVVGILRDVVAAYERRDATLARLVLQSEDAVTAFKAEILRQAERSVASGEMGVDLAFDLHELSSQCLLMSDHATNVAEQVIYETTGVIIRHFSQDKSREAAGGQRGGEGD